MTRTMREAIKLNIIDGDVGLDVVSSRSLKDNLLQKGIKSYFMSYLEYSRTIVT